MPPTRHALLGATTLLPLLATAYLAAQPLERVAGAAPWAGTAVLLGMAALFVLMAHAARADRPVGWRTGWTVALAGVVAASLYWALHVRPHAAVA